MSRVDNNGAAFAGSQLQTQLYVNRRREQLDEAIREAFPELADATFEWRSPLAEEKYAEYYGSAFLKRLDLDEHVAALKEFWPARGPQWDALALILRPNGQLGVLLAEGKSHVAEMLKGSAVTSAHGTRNRKLIEAALAWTQEQLRVSGKSAHDWSGTLYQNANRLAHLCWLRSRGVDAWFVHLLFTDDPIGPASKADWTDAINAANRSLGIDGKPLDGVGHVILPAGTREELLDSREVAFADDVGERHLPRGLWELLTSSPADAPMHLALAAVDRWGQQARDYCARVRREHPDATSQELAQMVKARHALLARMHGAAAGVPGAVAAGPGAAAAFVPDLVSLAWLQARMVVHIAAVYGHDTRDKEVVLDLLVLQGFYASTEAARLALSQATTRVTTRAVMARVRGPALKALKHQFKRVHIKFTRVGLLKAIPFVAVPLSAAVNEASTRSLAKRAVSFYETKPLRKE